MLTGTGGIRRLAGIGIIWQGIWVTIAWREIIVEVLVGGDGRMFVCILRHHHYCVRTQARGEIRVRVRGGRAGVTISLPHVKVKVIIVHPVTQRVMVHKHTHHSHKDTMTRFITVLSLTALQ